MKNVPIEWVSSSDAAAFAPDAVTFWGKCSKHFIRELACRNGESPALRLTQTVAEWDEAPGFRSGSL
ncbi:hypothetical protein NXV14_20380 [Bacteroides fragilis]|nr:hypothetical protein [Bacteroides fragilis]